MASTLGAASSSSSSALGRRIALARLRLRLAQPASTHVDDKYTPILLYCDTIASSSPSSFYG